MLFVLLFCYMFAFYVGGISISIGIAFPLFAYALLNKKYLNAIRFVISSKYIIRVAFSLFGILAITLLFPILYGTYDLSFFYIVATQYIHLIAAVPVFAFLKYKDVSYQHVERMFIVIFIVQTIIQLIVLQSRVLGEMILHFNHFEPEKVLGIGSNIRGKALSAATTYHLTIAYGFAFMLYVKYYFNRAINLKILLAGVLIFVGIFFAGRSGFVGCLLAVLGSMVYRSDGFKGKFVAVVKSLLLLLFVLFLLNIILYQFFEDFYQMLLEQILPYAFEFLYSVGDSGKMETQSTNQLLGMWQNDFNYVEFFLGSGRYTGIDGKYYMHVDPGVLRHTLFMGILGYLCLVVYQLMLLPVVFQQNKDGYYFKLMFLYIFIMDFKGVTLGVNKFVFAICLLLSFSYLYLDRDSSSKRINLN